MTTPTTNKADLIREARTFITDLALMVNAVHQRHVAPIKALNAIDEFLGRLKAAPDPEDFKRYEHTIVRTRKVIEEYHKDLN